MSAVPDGGFVYFTVFWFVDENVATYSVFDILARNVGAADVPSDDAPVYVVAMVTAPGVTAYMFMLVATPFPPTGKPNKLSERYTQLYTLSPVVGAAKAVPFIVMTVPLTELINALCTFTLKNDQP